MPRLNRNLHVALHVLAMLVAAWGLGGAPTALAPWACIATHGLGAFTHKPETNASWDTEFLAIVRVSLGVVACLIAAGQHWVTGTTGPEFVVIAMASLLLEAARPQKG